VVGPATDGGYYLIGMNRPHPELFEQVAWGTERVLAQTLDIAARAELPVEVLEPWADVDTMSDLRRATRLAGAAPRTAAWVESHPAT
jgi:uncharacterized protein